MQCAWCAAWKGGKLCSAIKSLLFSHATLLIRTISQSKSVPNIIIPSTITTPCTQLAKHGHTFQDFQHPLCAGGAQKQRLRRQRHKWRARLIFLNNYISGGIVWPIDNEVATQRWGLTENHCTAAHTAYTKIFTAWMRSPPLQHPATREKRPVLALCFGAGALQRPFLSASLATVYYMNTTDAAFSNWILLGIVFDCDSARNTTCGLLLGSWPIF